MTGNNYYNSQNEIEDDYQSNDFTNSNKGPQRKHSSPIKKQFLEDKSKIPNDFEDEYNQREDEEAGFGDYQQKFRDSQLNNKGNRNHEQRLKPMKSMEL